jgi:tRNA A37 threonylcarbamoyladenosine synthetase subunit TsaC/SUA5/YrdC
MTYLEKVRAALEALRAKHVIITQSDTMLSLTCIPDSNALHTLSKIKERPGPFILTGSSIEQLIPYINLEDLNNSQFDALTKYYKHPTSLIVPAREPSIITGHTDKICVRILHPCIMRDISVLGDIPLLSTSVNPAGATPATNMVTATQYFDNDYPFFLDTNKAPLHSASHILDVLTNNFIRK